MSDAPLDEEGWCAQQRLNVCDYLSRQEGLMHGEVGDWPAWHVAPYLSVWAVESTSTPGWVGWWAVSGDGPTDYCSAKDCRHPRLALRRIANSWIQALDATGPNDTIINGIGLGAELAPLLRARADVMLAYAADDEIWPD